MRYVLEMVRKKTIDDAYRIYVSDTLYFMAQGQAPNMRWREFIEQTKPMQEDDRDPEEIKQSMKDKLSRLAVMN